MDFFNTYIKPHACAFLVTAAGVYFLTPILQPKIANLPVLNMLDGAKQSAVLAGIYAGSSVMVCEKSGLVSILG